MEDKILDLLRRHAALGVDQSLLVSEIAASPEVDADPESVLEGLQAFSGKGLVHKESFWWYPGPSPSGLRADIDQA